MLLGPGSPQRFVVARHSPVFPSLSEDCHPAAVTGRFISPPCKRDSRLVNQVSLVVHNHVSVFVGCVVL